MDEFDLIDRFFRPLATDPGAHGLQDDGASLPHILPGQEWRLTTDTLIEDVHFRKSDPLDDVAHRALATNVSDLVAQLAEPKFYLLNLSYCEHQEGLELFAAGLAQAQKVYGMSLLGGDTTRTPGPLTISITAFGLGQVGRNPLRCKAKPGQRVGLLCAPYRGGIGGLGAARAGFEGVKGFDNAYLRPECCVTYLPDLMNAKISAMADVSDGLVQDLGHICAASGVGAELHLDRIPVALSHEPKVPQITWGDDYALVMTADALPDIAGLFDIGHIISGAGVKLLDQQGAEVWVETPGYVHGGAL